MSPRPPETPLELPPPPLRTVGHLLRRALRFGPARPFLIGEDGRIHLTYGDFLAAVAGAASALAARFAPGQRILCALPNGPHYFVLRYALSCAGLVEVAVNPQHRGDVLRRMLEITGPAAVATTADGLMHVRECGYDIAKVAVIDEAEVEEIARRRAAFDALPEFSARPEDACRILFSSGTTGFSKAIELSHGYEVYTGQRHVGLLDIGVRDRWLYVTPMFHIDAVYITSILLHTGGSLVLAEGFSRSRFWEIAERSGATFLCYVGAILAILLTDPSSRHAGGLRYAVGGGASPEQIEAFERRFGVRVIEAYAMTECIACTLSPYEEQKRATMGRPLPGYEVCILDANGRRCAPGRAGEIAVRSEEPLGLFTRYLGPDPPDSRPALDGWFRTGDLGSLDADGYLRFLGRLTDSVRVKGENVSCLEVERAFEGYPAIKACAAVGVPSPLADEDILLYVEPAPGCAIDPVGIDRHARVRLAPFMVPRYLKVVDALPRTATEKVAKSALPRSIADALPLPEPDA